MNDPLIQDSINFARSNKHLFIDAACSEVSESESPIAVFMAGTPGAGKTEVAKNIMAFFDVEPCRIDADDFRKLIPGYNGANSSLVQPAAAMMVDKVLDVVFSKSYSFILDGTFAVGKSVANIKRALRHGFEVQIYFVYQEPKEAWAFTKARELKEGRNVPLETFIDAYFKSRENVKKVKEEFGDQVLLQVIVKSYHSNEETVHNDVQDLDKVLPILYNKDELKEILNG